MALYSLLPGVPLSVLPLLAMTDAGGGGAVGARSVRPRLEFRKKKRTRSEWIKEIAWVQLATGWLASCPEGCREAQKMYQNGEIRNQPSVFQILALMFY